jgi:arrestin-related trafficking adapter 9
MRCSASLLLAHSLKSAMKRARALVGGFKKPFDKQGRHVPEFHIQLDDAHREYGPGDFVSGSVVLIVTKPIDITHLVICLHGFAQAYKTPNSPGERYRDYNAALIAGRTDRGGGYYGRGFISLFEDESILCGEGRLPAQQFRFGFELEFPRERLPSSIDVSRLAGCWTS